MRHLPWSLCCENHSITCWSSLGYLGVKQPIIARFADILSSPERIVACSLLQRRIMDSLSPYSLAIYELFSTALASAITFILKAMEYAERRAFGITIKTTEIVVFMHSHVIYKLCRIIWYWHLHWFATFSFVIVLFIIFCVQWAISQCFPWGSLTQMAGYNQEFPSRLMVDGFTFFFSTKPVCWKVTNF